MKKFLIWTSALYTVLTLCVLSATAEVDPIANRKIDDIRKGKRTKNAIIDGLFLDDIKVEGDHSVSGNVTIVSNVTVNGNFDLNGNLEVETNTVALNGTFQTVWPDSSATNKGTVNWQNNSVSTNVSDADLMLHNMFRGRNDSSEFINWVQFIARSVDVTTNTEDGQFEVWLPVGGTDEEVFRVNNRGGRFFRDLRVNDSLSVDTNINCAKIVASNHLTTVGFLGTGGFTNTGAGTFSADLSARTNRVVIGPNNTTTYMEQWYIVTNAAGEAAVTFSPAFSAAPVSIQLTPLEGGWTNNPPYTLATNWSATTVNVLGDGNGKVIGVHVIGPR